MLTKKAAGLFISALVAFTCAYEATAAAPDHKAEDLWHAQCEQGDQAEIARNFVTAEKYFREGLATARTSFGAQSRQVLTSTARVGTILVLQGHLQEAETFFQQSIVMIRSIRTSAEPDPDALVWLDDFSDAYQHMAEKNPAKGQYCLEHCIAIRNAIAPGRHSKLAMACRDLSLILIRSDKFAEAEKVINLQITAMNSQYGKQPQLFAPLGNLAIVQEKQKKYAEAEKNMAAAMALMAQAQVSPMYQDAYKRDLLRIQLENQKLKATK